VTLCILKLLNAGNVLVVAPVLGEALGVGEDVNLPAAAAASST